MKTKGMNLRRSSVIVLVITACLAVMVAAALVDMTAQLHGVARRVGTAVEGVRISEQIALELASLRDAGDAMSRVSTEEDLTQLLGEATHYVDSERELVTLNQLIVASSSYLAALRDLPADASSMRVRADTRGDFDVAYRAARELGRVNVEQSRALTRLASRLDRNADLIGIPAALVFALGLGAAAWYLQRRAFRPALALVGSIERYAQGDRSARAAEEGPVEFRSIAHRFNDMASTLEDQRNARLAFLAGVAHDLRNPLTALRLATEMITPDEPLPTEARMRQLFGRVQRQIDRMERMVHDLMDAARIEAGNLQLQLETCDACELARAMVDLFEPATRTHRLVMDLPGQPVVFRCDPVRIEQVLTNLLNNAIKYSPQGGTVRVTVTRDEDSAVMAVSDQGIGMSNAEREHVFELFRRTDAAKATSPGVGLGLFVARRIVEAHGGHITVASAVGKGSTFTVRLPTGTDSP
ncbi:MAG: HAMP domain-containing histidine kinase [Kofleriaceae bacterium]|nr:HAMP domain-containing histidine kinase [Kofleriaceae bacterium]